MKIDVEESVTGKCDGLARNRWPSGIWGTFRYYVDHLLLRCKAPVDWSGLRAIEESIAVGYPVFAGGFALLGEDEAKVFKLLATETEISALVSQLGMSEAIFLKAVEGLKRKLGATSLLELSKIAVGYIR